MDSCLEERPVSWSEALEDTEEAREEAREDATEVKDLQHIIYVSSVKVDS
jgi:hypothetical protein